MVKLEKDTKHTTEENTSKNDIDLMRSIAINGGFPNHWTLLPKVKIAEIFKIYLYRLNQEQTVVLIWDLVDHFRELRSQLNNAGKACFEHDILTEREPFTLLPDKHMATIFYEWVVCSSVETIADLTQFIVHDIKEEPALLTQLQVRAMEYFKAVETGGNS
jgi:hypothetical protein